MGLLKKLKKIHKKLDPLGNKVHEKLGGKVEAKLVGKTPLSKIVDGRTSRKSVAGSKVTGGNAPGNVATSAVGNVPSKPLQVGGKPTGGNAKPAMAGGFNRAGAARLNRLVGSKKLSRK